MTAAILTHLPVAAGGALLAATGNAIHWGFMRYMRAPLANTAVLAMVSLSAMAGSNALYNQRHEHPAPLFAPAGEVTRQAAVPAAIVTVVPVPATRHKKPQLITPISSEETGSVNPAAEVKPKPIGNAEVTEIQRKLQSMQIYDGAIDGLYGPQTARAIKKFEVRMGQEPKGKLTLELLEAVRAAPVILPELAVEPLPTPDPLPAAKKPAAAVEALPVAAEPEPEEAAATTEFRAVTDKPTVEADLEPLPAPAPLQLATEPVAKQQVKRRELPETPEEAFDLVVDTAGQAIETIADGVQSLGMTTPPKKKPKAEVQQFAAQPAPVAAAAPAAELDPIKTASIDPQVGVTLAMPEEAPAKSSDDVAVLDTDAKPEELMPPFSVTDPVLVAKVQRGLASLGFLYGPADGVAGEATAKAIRNFEVYYNYRVTGRISPELLDLLVQNGASI